MIVVGESTVKLDAGPNKGTRTTIRFGDTGSDARLSLGDAILVPITEVGSVACALGWSATCAACLAIARARPSVMMLSSAERAIAWFGLAVGIAMSLMKLIPLVPGHFSDKEWLALGIWIALGAIALRKRSTSGSISNGKSANT